jgi:hypothetical protein
VTVGVVVIVLLLGAVRLSAQAPPRPAADPAQAGVPDIGDLTRLMQMMMQMQNQQLQQMMNQQAAQLGGGRGFGSASATETRLGALIQAPPDALTEQLDLPAGQGQVVTKVNPGEPAERAGVQAHDILLELDGKPVSSDPATFARSVADIKAKVPVDVLVLRKGAKKKLAGLTLAEAPLEEAGGLGGFPQLPPLPGRGFGPRGLNIPHGPVGGLPGNGAGALGGQNALGGGTFSVSLEQDGVTIDVAGTTDNGVATVTDITITDGGKPRHFPSVDKVPEEYRDKVKALIDRATKLRAGANAANP